jgi:hypothetical protein
MLQVMLAVPALVSLALHAMWWSGNLYEAVVMMPPWLRSWRAGHAPGMRIDPRVYYIAAAPVAFVASLAAAGLGYSQAFPLRLWLLVAAGGSLIAIATTAYAVAAINLELFYADPPPPAVRGLALVNRWRIVNLARLLVLTVVLVATARACWELPGFHAP